MKQFIFMLLSVVVFSCQQEKTTTFTLCTDVHQDLIHDASNRLNEFIKTSENENADFILQLGDFCLPLEKNQTFLNLWNSFKGPKYHVLGNHDMDISPKIVTQEFWGMEKPYYSFDQGDFHFVVLDPNYYKDGEEMVSYENGNYYNYADNRAFIPESQLNWLRNDLADTDKYTLIFSHQSLEHKHGIKNREEVHKIFAEANMTSKKVIACFCGHDHEDRYVEIEGIHYIGLNSTSYTWVGDKLEYSGRFSEQIEKEHPNLKYTCPYQKSVFAIIELNSKGTITINGVQSDFVKPGPDELGAENHNYSAGISNRTLIF
ncbi:metallophosphoesterase [Prolixibacteraceae bacterium Z1-6]|uniref:Metallophosphoesterase n=1 Tax=Draconibacterium aestuarii TaxID=2998507 RepID=A0A9X3J7T9_9BACT|nr:metallophosphoesterase [Prolixibacteraceae bacterium Z1-6]